MDPELIRACQNVTFGVTGILTAQPLLLRLLGPSFEYVGQAMADLLARYGNENVREIFQRVAGKVTPDKVDQGVSPRVLKAVVEEGSFVHDAVMQEYFASLLATSFGEDDDGALTFINIVKNLTTTQVKTHYLFYSVKRRVHDRRCCAPLPPDIGGETFVPNYLLDQYTKVNDVNGRRQAIRGLVHEGLLGSTFDLQAVAFKPRAQTAVEGIVVSGTVLGAELFLWVHGARHAAPEMLCSPQLPLRDWGGDGIDTRGVLTCDELAQQRETGIALLAVRNLCMGNIDNQAALIAIDDSVARLLESKLRHWLTRDFKKWLSQIRFSESRDRTSELKDRVEQSLSLLGKYRLG